MFVWPRRTHSSMRLNLSGTDAGLPLSPQYFAFVRSIRLLENGSYEVFVYPVLSLGAMAGYCPFDSAPHLSSIRKSLGRFALGGFSSIHTDSSCLNAGLSVLSSINLRCICSLVKWDHQIRLSHRKLRQIDNYRNTISSSPTAIRRNRRWKRGWGVTLIQG